jgi:hypothetical protein
MPLAASPTTWYSSPSEISAEVAALSGELNILAPEDGRMAARDPALHFELGPVELEFTLDVRKEGGADGGIRWGVVSFGARGSVASSTGHRVKLVLTPRDAATGGTAEVGSARR